MFKALRRWWKYMGAKLSGSLEERADPKVQLEQAIQEAQEQHRRLTEQAANVIAHQKQTQMRLDRAQDDLDKVTGNARQEELARMLGGIEITSKTLAHAGDMLKRAQGR